MTIAGVDNPLSSPIYMVKLNLDNAVYAGKKDVELTLDKFPGFKLEIAKDSVTFPDGSREGFVSVTPVNAAAVPMAPPNGMQPQFIVTIQPTGTQFYPPARLTLPNVDGHSPGAQVEMYSFDHDLEEFVAIGLGTVSEDGSLVKSNPGVGVVKAGWHCGSQPGGSGCCENQQKTCDYCSNKKGSCPGTCEFVPDRIAETQVPGNCQREYCGPSKPDNNDIPTTEQEVVLLLKALQKGVNGTLTHSKPLQSLRAKVENDIRRNKSNQSDEINEADVAIGSLLMPINA